MYNVERHTSNTDVVRKTWEGKLIIQGVLCTTWKGTLPIQGVLRKKWEGTLPIQGVLRKKWEGTLPTITFSMFLPSLLRILNTRDNNETKSAKALRSANIS